MIDASTGFIILGVGAFIGGFGIVIGGISKWRKRQTCRTGYYN